MVSLGWPGSLLRPQEPRNPDLALEREVQDERL